MSEYFCELSAEGLGCISLLNVARILALAFLAVLFVQSGLDKVFDWEGNIGWLKGHFEKTPLAGMVPLMVGLITLMELVSGVVSGLGAGMILLYGDRGLGALGALLSTVTVLALFSGQRMAKDYPGAAVLANYFVLCLAAIFLML